jgi:trimeric autotransporter adhesin
MVNFTINFGKISAITAKSFKVIFNTAPKDTSKVVFTIKRGSIPVSLTATWNDAKTEATLTNSSKLVEGDYTIAIKNDTTDLDSKNVKVENEKVAKIEFLSDTIVRANDYSGYITYKVSNQYGEDITNSALASNITWTSSVTATPVAKTNKILFTQGTSTPSLSDLKYLPSVVISAFDSNSGTFASATLKVSQVVGGVADLTFNGIVDKDGNAVDLVAGSTTDYYLSFKAVDAFNNVVDDYATLSNANIVRFIPSSTLIANLQVVHDPTNYNKAALKVTPATSLIMDTPVVLTGICIGTGKNATLTVTVKKQASLANLLIQAPSVQVAVGETIDIPFYAYDQNGNQMTSWAQLQGTNSYVTINGPVSTPVTEVRDANGNYVMRATFTQAGKYYITAAIPTTGKISQTSFDVKDAAYPVTLGSLSFYPYYVAGANQSVDYGYAYGGIELKDQYDRDISLLYNQTYNGATYKVEATSSDPTIIAVTPITTPTSALKLTAGSTLGTATVTFNLIKTVSGADTIVDTKTVSITTIDRKDVTSYAIGSIPTLYANAQSTDKEKSYGWTMSVYGKTASGAKVRIPSTDVVATSTSDARFVTDGRWVYALPLGSNVTDASAKVYATINSVGGTLQTISADVKATAVAPVATSISIDVPYYSGTNVINTASKVGDTINISQADLVAQESLYAYNAAGAANTFTTKQFISISVDDSYGLYNYAMNPVYTVIKKTDGTVKATVDTNGIITWASAPVAGESYILTTVTSNGITATAKINVK